ncbi:MAG: MotA/TolQ/ExbB proton channel family protein [Bradymonadaceae bacterium]|nr:MotA/TolQ/ExbB proton channel family protein [Lujinxingiaceae bacterium]
MNAIGLDSLTSSVSVLQNLGLGILATAGGEAPASAGFVMRQYLDAGGFMMYVILCVSIVGVALFLIRMVELYVLRRLNVRSFVSKIGDFVEHRRFRDALDACEVSSKHPLIAVTKAGLLRANRREKDIERAMEKELLSAIPSLQRGVDLMAVLANTSTLLGLLGTIFGLISAFSSVAAASAVERQEALAAGISQAMYTTAFGIGVAVPLLVFHHFLSKRSEQIMVEAEGGATALLVSISGVAHNDSPARTAPASQDGRSRQAV